ncbi:triphosphoribosyl-dephospho-CoA synthase CitG [Anaerosphaera multitolerans]|uniref:triphosphoribosyl-dephospho-CoA synthase n=1 Tax=Anaerosphaera multitolerans TaxID=2487351 RepID=A0A437S870_9FIRM|nr:triphosphoribosyl-dephospho-CoA synthase CitG [Anaerosphaera multitolerans]RVU55273.1 triphosphoribosyl-dephospho-CoA synthase CitG [Anaerosphaera multitolerans]
MSKLTTEIVKRMAFYALIYEVSVTPKPGLVDLKDNGSHTDMNYFTFINSALSLPDYFEEVYMLGKKGNNEKNFKRLREIGMEYEARMFNATKGVNTHKGAIFSLGMIVYSTAVVKSSDIEFNPLTITEEVKRICSGISSELENNTLKTQGQIQYGKYGLKGIRGEAEEGFRKAVTIGLKNLKRCLETLDLNDSLVEVLMYFLREIDDSNTIKRSSLKGLEYVKNSADKAISLGGMHTEEGRKYIYEMNDQFILRNISPGGCADYLALTLYFYFLEEYYD